MPRCAALAASLVLPLVGSHWDDHREDRASSRLAFNGNSAMMLLNDLVADG